MTVTRRELRRLRRNKAVRLIDRLITIAVGTLVAISVALSIQLCALLLWEALK